MLKYNYDQVILISKRVQLRFVFHKYLFMATRLFTFLIEALGNPLTTRKKRSDDMGKVIKITRRFQEILLHCINSK